MTVYKIKNGYFSQLRTQWSDMDIAIVQRIADGYKVSDIAIALGMQDKYFQRIVLALRTLRKAKTNAQLVAIAMREGVIK